MTMTEPPSDGLRVREQPPPDEPPPEHRHRDHFFLFRSIAALWSARELVRSLAERDMRARYKQTYLGFAWAVITPFLLMLVFVVFFKRVAKPETHGVPYPIFAYVGLLPWTYFSTAVSQGGTSLVTNVPLLNKVYCPREVFPLSSTVLAFIDSMIAFSALVVLFAVNWFSPRGTSVYVPLLLLLLLAFTVGVVLILSVIVVYFRDLRTTLPLMLQLGLFATPVAYGIDNVPNSYRPLYAASNPLVSVIDGLRRTVLYGQAPDWNLFLLSSATALVVLVGGYALFKRMEGGIADVA